MRKPKKRWWTIWVGGWGVHEMRGTEEEAEAMRAHKARWEQAPAKKYLGKIKGQILDNGRLR